MARFQLESIGQLLNKYYGPHMVRKDAPVLTTTTGVYNAVFGAMAFSQLNNEANVFGVLPKRPWSHSGWRAITADAGSVGDGGVAENGAIPATAKPTFAEITVTPATVAHAFDVSWVHSLLVKSGDDAIGDAEFLRGYGATLHAKRINQQLCIDGNTLASAGNTMESIDRVTITSAAATSLSWDAADEDIYGIDRSANAWADAGVTDHNSGTDRYLTDAHIRDNIFTLEEKGARTNIILTGSDTKSRIIALFGNQVKYPGVLGDARVKATINGVETEEGMNAGVRVATVYNIPLIVSQAVQKDTISRIYLLDTTVEESTGWPRLFIGLLAPTLYFESGMDTTLPDPFPVNRFGTELVYVTVGNLVCTFFQAQGSVRDLK